MENGGPSATTRLALYFPASPRLLSLGALFLKRPLLIGALTLLAAAFSHGDPAQNPLDSEGKMYFDSTAERASTATRHHHGSDDDEIPLLFLALMGLGALTLSQIRPSEIKTPPVDVFDAGKNVDCGQELPETAPETSGLATPCDL